MIKLKEILGNEIKRIIGYIDNYGSVQYYAFDNYTDYHSHEELWHGAAKLNKWRWYADNPNHLNTYGDTFTPEEEDTVWAVIDRYRL